MTTATSSTGAPMATIKNIFPSNKGKPKCLGHYITDYYHYKNKEACTELPWATRVHLHAESRPWEFQAVPGTDCFNIIDDAKPDGCLKYLSASARCSEQYVHLAARDDGSGLQRWRLVGYKGPPPTPVAKSPPRSPLKPSPPLKSPPPPPRSPVKTPPPPKAKPVAPQLISVSASSPTTGSVVFQPTAGASYCNVTVSKDGQTVIRTITSLNYPFTNFYPAGLASDTDYSIKVLCQLPSGATLPAPVDGTLHTPPNSGHPAVINVVPTSGTSGNITIVPPDALVCKAKKYEVKATPKAGGATQTFTSTSLTVALTGLTPGVQYSVVVDAICDDGSTTKPSDPIYFTPLKSTTPPSSPPPPLPKPSSPPSPSISPSPGSKAPPPAVKPSPPPPPPKLNECTTAPTVILVSTEPTKAMDLPVIQIIPPLIPGCANMSYIVSTVSGDLTMNFTAADAKDPFGIGFPPGSQITVQGVCPDDKKTPTSIPVSIPACAAGTLYNSATGFCTALSPPPAQSPPPPPSPPPPITCLPGQYNTGGTCAACPSITGCHQVMCTSAATSTCAQCDVGYLPDGVVCKTDPCASAPAGANTQSGNIGFDSFVKFTNKNGTTFQPGTYEIRYADGCMKYGGGQLWTVNAQFPNYGWYIGTVRNDKKAEAPGAKGYLPCGIPGGSIQLTPGNGCGFEDFNKCVDYSKNLANVPPVVVTLTSSSELGVWIQDGANGANEYGDNVAGIDGRNPSWSVRLQGC